NVSNAIDLVNDETICTVLFCPKAGSLNVDFALSILPFNSFGFYVDPADIEPQGCSFTLPSDLVFEFENYHVQGKVYRPSGHCSTTQDGLLNEVTSTFKDLCNGEDYMMSPFEDITGLQG